VCQGVIVGDQGVWETALGPQVLLGCRVALTPPTSYISPTCWQCSNEPARAHVVLPIRDTDSRSWVAKFWYVSCCTLYITMQSVDCMDGWIRSQGWGMRILTHPSPLPPPIVLQLISWCYLRHLHHVLIPSQHLKMCQQCKTVSILHIPISPEIVVRTCQWHFSHRQGLRV
jgi:hypothetical protein